MFCLCVCMHTLEIRRECWIPWNWRYRWLWITVWILGTKPRTSKEQVLLIAESFSEPLPALTLGILYNCLCFFIYEPEILAIGLCKIFKDFVKISSRSLEVRLTDQWAPGICLPATTFPMLGSQACATMPGFSHRYWRSNLGPHEGQALYWLSCLPRFIILFLIMT